MRVFVTGATGWIGTAVVAELRAAGHDVLGMAHSDAGAEKLKALGVEVHRADLRDPEALIRGVQATDATIHLAFHMDFSDIGGMLRVDRVAIAAMLDAMAATEKPFLSASGTLLEVADSTSPFAERVRAEQMVVEAAHRGVRSSVVRLAPTVHGRGDKGFVAMLVKLAREKRVAAYIDAGDQRWPAVHREDAARLYRLAVENAPAGMLLRATAEAGITQREIAATIGECLGLPTVSVSAADAPAHFGWMESVVRLDNVALSVDTQRLLGWTPRCAGLIEDMRAHYFTE